MIYNIHLPSSEVTSRTFAESELNTARDSWSVDTYNNGPVNLNNNGFSKKGKIICLSIDQSTDLQVHAFKFKTPPYSFSYRPALSVFTKFLIY